MDTAVKTATTGYIQRRQMKAMEDHKVCYDGTVRNAEEAIIDFSYGGDGMDASLVERVSLGLLQDPLDEAAWRARLSAWEYDTMQRHRALVMACKCNLTLAHDPRVLLPFNPERVAATQSLGGPPAQPEELHAALCDFVEHEVSSTYNLAVLEHFHVAAMLKARLSVPGAVALFKQLENAIADAQVNAGEMVGPIAAQSIGEPCTQARRGLYHPPAARHGASTLHLPPALSLDGRFRVFLR